MKQQNLSILKLILILLSSSIFLFACPNPTSPSPVQSPQEPPNSSNKDLIAKIYSTIKTRYLDVNNGYTPVSGEMLISHAKKGIDDYFKKSEKSSSDISLSYVPVSWDSNKLTGNSDELNIDILWQYIQDLLKDKTVLALLTKKIANKYKTSSNNNPITQKELILTIEAIRGMISGLGDRFSVLLDTASQEIYSQLANNQIAGIGIQIRYWKNNQGKMICEVIEPRKDSTAYRSGIRTGDIILSIDGKKTSMMNIEDILSLLRGRPGTLVTLSLKIPERTQPFTLTLKRSINKIPSIQQGIISAQDILDQNLLTNPAHVSSIAPIGYIHILQFDNNTANSVRESLNRQRRQKIRGLILDLRNNPGGLIYQAQEIADFFLEKGETISIYKTRLQNKVQTFKLIAAHSAILDKDIPIVVLINHNTASSSEILLGALENRLKITFLGNKTYGKGVGQTIYSHPISNGASKSLISLKITVFEFFTSNMNKINKHGFLPDKQIATSVEEKKALRSFYLSGELSNFISNNKNSFKEKLLPKQTIQNFINRMLSSFSGINKKLLELVIWNEVYRIRNNEIVSYNIQFDEVLRASIPYILNPVKNKKITLLKRMPMHNIAQLRNLHNSFAGN